MRSDTHPLPTLDHMIPPKNSNSNSKGSSSTSSSSSSSGCDIFGKYHAPCCCGFIESVLMIIVAPLVFAGLTLIIFCPIICCKVCCCLKKKTLTDEQYKQLLAVIAFVMVFNFIAGVFAFVGNADVHYTPTNAIDVFNGTFVQIPKFVDPFIHKILDIDNSLANAESGLVGVVATVPAIGQQIINNATNEVNTFVNQMDTAQQNQDDLLNSFLSFNNSLYSLHDTIKTAKASIGNVSTSINNLQFRTINGTSYSTGTLPNTATWQNGFPNPIASPRVDGTIFLLQNSPSLSPIVDEINGVLQNISSNVDPQLNSSLSKITDELNSNEDKIHTSLIDAYNQANNYTENFLKVQNSSSTDPFYSGVRTLRHYDAYRYDVQLVLIVFIWVFSSLGLIGVLRRSSCPLITSVILMLFLIFFTWWFIALYFPITHMFLDVCDALDNLIFVQVRDRFISIGSTEDKVFTVTEGCILGENFITLIEGLNLTVAGINITGQTQLQQSIKNLIPHFNLSNTVDVTNSFNISDQLQQIDNAANSSDFIKTVGNSELNGIDLNDSGIVFNSTTAIASLTNWWGSLSYATFGYSPSTLDTCLDDLNNYTQPDYFTRTNLSTVNPSSYSNPSEVQTLKDRCDGDYQVETEIDDTIATLTESYNNITVELNGIEDTNIAAVQSDCASEVANRTTLKQKLDSSNNQYVLLVSDGPVVANDVTQIAVNQVAEAENRLYSDMINLADNFIDSVVNFNDLGDCQIIPYLYYGITGMFCTIFLPGGTAIWLGLIMMIACMLILIIVYIILAEHYYVGKATRGGAGGGGGASVAAYDNQRIRVEMENLHHDGGEKRDNDDFSPWAVGGGVSAVPNNNNNNIVPTNNYNNNSMSNLNTIPNNGPAAVVFQSTPNNPPLYDNNGNHGNFNNNFDNNNNNYDNNNNNNNAPPPPGPPPY